MTANEYAQLSIELYAKAKAIKVLSEGPEKSALLLIAWHLEQGARVAREASEAKARGLIEAASK